jgi:hypothetical protein
MDAGMAEDPPLEKLRAYLRVLKPEARAMLLASLEQAALRGDHVVGGDVILQELRREVRSGEASASQEADRVATPARLFFQPLEPYLVDDTPEKAHRGRVPRPSLEPIWQWICRDLMPSEAKAYGDQITKLLLTNDRVMSERLARAFQDQAAERIRDALNGVQSDLKARQRLAGQIGTPRALDDLREIGGILRARDALAVFGSRLPSQIRNLADEQLDNVKTLPDSPVGGHPEVFVYALILVMGRLSAPWQLVRLAVKAADSDVAAKVAGTSYAVAVTIVLAEMERLVGVLCDDVRRGRFGAVGDCSRASTTRRAHCAPKWTCRGIRPGRASSRPSAARCRSWSRPRSRRCPVACGACYGCARTARSGRAQCWTKARSTRPKR